MKPLPTLKGRIIPETFDFSMRLVKVNGKTGIVVQKHFTDRVIIKELAERALKGEPLVARIVFKDPFKAVLSIKEEGLLE